MQEFEYKRVEASKMMRGYSVDLTKLNEMGIEGWELCYVTNWEGKPAFFYFKRQLPKQNPKE